VKDECYIKEGACHHGQSSSRSESAGYVFMFVIAVTTKRLVFAFSTQYLTEVDSFMFF
jgi:hypothetical protein